MHDGGFGMQGGGLGVGTGQQWVAARSPASTPQHSSHHCTDAALMAASASGMKKPIWMREQRSHAHLPKTKIVARNALRVLLAITANGWEAC